MNIRVTRRSALSVVGVGAGAGAGALAIIGACSPARSTTATTLPVATLKPTTVSPTTLITSAATTAKPPATTAKSAATTAKLPATTVKTPATFPAAKIGVNTATDADPAKIPGMTPAVIAIIDKNRPFPSASAFRSTLGKSVPAAQLAGFEKYLSF